MLKESLIKKYIDIVKSDEEKFYNDYLKTKKSVGNSTAIYKGEPVPFLYQPMFHTEEDINSFESLTDTLMSILNKVINRYLNNDNFRKKFGFPKELEELILIDPGYDVSVPVGRFDVFYKNKDNFKFCELNADGASAMNEDNELDRIIQDTLPINELDYDVSYLELIDKWVDESISLYNKYDKNNSKPNIAIMDLSGGGTIIEFEEFKKAYIKKGYNTEIVDPRDLVYKDGFLYHNDFRIDMIYRRLVTCELLENIHEMPDFIEAYKDRAVCVIGGIRSQIIHNKIIFKILHDEDNIEYLSEEEVSYVKNHIPYTAKFEIHENIKEECIINKDKYVLKPEDLYASKGVYIGRDYSNEEWEALSNKCFNNEYLLQEFCEPYKVDMVVISDGNIEVQKFGHLIGLFMYNEKFAGFYTRVGQNNIISSSYGGYSVANLIIKDTKGR